MNKAEEVFYKELLEKFFVPFAIAMTKDMVRRDEERMCKCRKIIEENKGLFIDERNETKGKYKKP